MINDLNGCWKDCHVSFNIYSLDYHVIYCKIIKMQWQL